MKALLLAMLMSGGGYQAASAQTTADTTLIRCRIKPEKSICQKEEVVRFVVELRNNTAVPQPLALGTDGSDVGWVCLSVAFAVYRLDKKATRTLVRPPLTTRCGDIDGIKAEDFVQLAPGEKIDSCARSRYTPRSWFSFYRLPIGEYEVACTYSTVQTAYCTFSIVE